MRSNYGTSVVNFNRTAVGFSTSTANFNQMVESGTSTANFVLVVADSALASSSKQPLRCTE